MPEPPAWRFQTILQPLFDRPKPPRILKGRLLTCVGDEVIEDGFVALRDGRIEGVGRIGELGEDSGDAEVLDCRGKTLLPGLMNSHVHLAWDGIHVLAQQAEDPPEISAFKSAGNLLKSLRGGVTLVRDLGMNLCSPFTKQAVEQGIFPGPRLLIAGQAIVQTAGHTYWCCREASGADEMRRAVREQVRAGADLIKIMGSHDTVEFSDDELHAVIDEAHRNGLPITAHATFDEAIERVVRFGVDVVEHGGAMRDETVALLLDRGVPIVTTFSPLLRQSQPELARHVGIPEWKVLERQRALADGTRHAGVVKAARAGVPIVFGTDAGSPATGHGLVVPELEYMVELGVVDDAYGAIRSATSEAAKLNGLDASLGTLEVGKEADLIVVDGNPLEELKALERVEMAMVAGTQMLA